MKTALIVFGVVIFVLGIVIFVLVLMNKNQKKEIEKLNSELAETETALEKLKETSKIKNEVEKEANEKKEKLNGGDSHTKFDNATNILFDK